MYSRFKDVFILVLLLLPTNGEGSGGWITHGNSSYLYIHDTTIERDEARKRCQREGRNVDLVEINSHGENAWIFDQTKKKDPKNNIWIRIPDKCSIEGACEEYWAKGGRSGQKCAEMLYFDFYGNPLNYEYENKGKWNDRPCKVAIPSRAKTYWCEQAAIKSCGVGKYLVESENQCVECPLGTYKDESTKETICQNCSKAKPYTRKTGSTSEKDCTNINCEAGEYLNAEDLCIKCERNTFKEGVSAESTCSPCPSEIPHTKLKGTTSKTLCTNLYCPGGKKLVDGNCVDCGENEVARNGTASSCDTAEEGEVPNDDKSEFVCKAGYGRNNETNKCQVCLEGKFKAGPGNRDCSKCPSNSVTVGDPTRCVCVAGFEFRDDHCAMCQAGSYKSAPGNMPCTECSGAEAGATSCDRWGVSLVWIIGLSAGGVVLLVFFIVIGVLYMKRNTQKAVEKASLSLAKSLASMIAMASRSQFQMSSGSQLSAPDRSQLSAPNRSQLSAPDRSQRSAPDRSAHHAKSRSYPSLSESESESYSDSYGTSTLSRWFGSQR